jgi:transposase InsO family protein
MVLHTDQDHPHVHLVVSAHRREGGRLNIRKGDLRRWREQFARQLHRQGVEANATPAQLRGRLSDHQKDGIFRAAPRRAAPRRAARRVACETGARAPGDPGHEIQPGRSIGEPPSDRANG